MTRKTLLIKELARFPQSGTVDEMQLSSGVNIVVGSPNTGKTKWLNMLDYLMGDPGKPEDAFGQDLVEKYDSIAALMSIDGEDFYVERKWKERGSKTKVYVDGNAITTVDFQHLLMDKLQIPLLNYPKGNPYEERKWPELSWRTLLRHIYRQQRFWTDIADKQTESEQHAVITQFLGIAEHLFSDHAGQLVQKRRELWKLEGAKEQFLKILDQIYREISDENEIQVALTSDSLDSVTNRIAKEIERLHEERERQLLSLQTATAKSLQSENSEYDDLGKQWVSLQANREENQSLLSKVEKRLKELALYRQTLENESTRISRAKDAGRIFIGLKVTNCPVCDQTVQAQIDDSHCYLCGQMWQTIPVSTGLDRIEVESKRLKDELKEVLDLTSRLSDEKEQLRKDIRNISEDLTRIENRLQPIRQVAAAIIPPEVSLIDMELGRLHEKQRQIARIKSTLEYQKLISSEVDKTKQQIGELESIVAKQNNRIHYTLMGDMMADYMTTYLNELEAAGNKAWTLGRVNVNLKERGVDFRIDGEKWSTKAGGTLSLYFLLSYHYGLMRLTLENGCHYPGLAILDLPATLADGSSIQDKENFIIEPFIRLLSRQGMENSQIIVAGAAFEGLEGVNRYELQKVWK